MRINADFGKRVVIRPEDYDWVHSPSNGVDRMMLDRIGDEVARATTIVRFAPESEFSEHTHGGGEEILVLDGTFSDESGDYPAGSYIRNPIGTSHAPKTAQGCTLFVKLHQFDPSDTDQKSIDTRSAEYGPGRADGISVLQLHSVPGETVSVVRAEPGARFGQHGHAGGEEILVLDGVLEDEHGSYPAGTWIRNPVGSEHRPFTTDGCTFYMKTGHLKNVG